MTLYAGNRTIAGTVIDGVYRDVSQALGDGYLPPTLPAWKLRPSS